MKAEVKGVEALKQERENKITVLGKEVEFISNKTIAQFNTFRGFIAIQPYLVLYDQ